MSSLKISFLTYLLYRYLSEILCGCPSPIVPFYFKWKHAKCTHGVNKLSIYLKKTSTFQRGCNDRRKRITFTLLHTPVLSDMHSDVHFSHVKNFKNEQFQLCNISFTWGYRYITRTMEKNNENIPAHPVIHSVLRN